jgi:hypothetical protein
MDLCPSENSSLVWMKTQLIMITSIPKSAPTNFGMESWYVDFELKLAHEDSTLKVQNLPLLILG